MKRTVLPVILILIITLLAGCSALPDTKPEIGKAEANGEKMYRVYVTDKDGGPAEGVMVQLCDDTACCLEKTDAKGVATFDIDENEYDVHILKVPEGYKGTEEIFRFSAEYSDMTIMLEKE